MGHLPFDYVSSIWYMTQGLRLVSNIGVMIHNRNVKRFDDTAVLAALFISKMSLKAHHRLPVEHHGQNGFVQVVWKFSKTFSSGRPLSQPSTICIMMMEPLLSHWSQSQDDNYQLLDDSNLFSSLPMSAMVFWKWLRFLWAKVSYTPRTILPRRQESNIQAVPSL